MITFVHLSDIHFSPRDQLCQLDLDKQIRRALEEDLVAGPTGTRNYDALLITGDIAFAGKPEEYANANNWLKQLFDLSGIPAASTYVVPGNHDVDRSYVAPALALFHSHQKIREEKNPVHWRDVIAKQLTTDPNHTMLSPLKAYNDFAQGYDCRTEPERLAWCRPLTSKELEGGFRVRLHGLNSALLSDEADSAGNLLVSEFQTSHFERTPGIVDIVLCHHPPDWLMDKHKLRDALRAFAPIALFGHEHTSSVSGDDKQVQLFAGAVQPSRRDPDWLPTYHIVSLTVSNERDQSELIVTVHTREFDKRLFKFRAKRDEQERPFEEYRLSLRNRLPASAAPIAIPSDPAISSGTISSSIVELEAEMKTESARRELLINFFRLTTPDRYAAANEVGLLRDGDDTLQPQLMWAEVFRRAASEKDGLLRLWDAVAARAPKLRNTPNPFRGNP